MSIIEVVAAIIEGNRLSTNLREIDNHRRLGRKVEFLGRSEAPVLAARYDDSLQLAEAPMLLILGNGVVFRPRHQRTQKPAAATESAPSPMNSQRPHPIYSGHVDRMICGDDWQFVAATQQRVYSNFPISCGVSN